MIEKIDQNSVEPFILPIGRELDRELEKVERDALIARVALVRDGGGKQDESDEEDFHYLIPEQFGQLIGAAIDREKADQFMLGVLAYEMASGHPPEFVNKPEELLTQGRKAFAPARPLEEVWPLCPRHVAWMVNTMICRDPSERFADIDTILREIDLHDTLALVMARDSYLRCVQTKDSKEEFFKAFYKEFLKRCHGAEQVFNNAWRNRDQMEAWKNQRNMLEQAVLLLFAFAQQPHGREQPNFLSRIVESHGKLEGITSGMYEDFLDALVVIACGDSETDARDTRCNMPELQEQMSHYWREALRPGIDHLINPSRADGTATQSPS